MGRTALQSLLNGSSLAETLVSGLEEASGELRESMQWPSAARKFLALKQEADQRLGMKPLGFRIDSDSFRLLSGFSIGISKVSCKKSGNNIY